jgi:rubrerythrin
MAMCEMYPATWQEFIEDKYFRDHKEIYTNGSEIMLVSDVKKMMQHYLQERPKGRWSKNIRNMGACYITYYQCSACGKSVLFGELDFCPNCGADMRDNEEQDV